MTWIYADYLKVRPDLVDVYTEEVDKTSPDLWQAFIPHQDMYQLLSRLLDSLERRGKDQTRSLWLHGAYGTGKTFAAFVVKHLLEDPLEVVEAYLTKHTLTRALWPRFRALRERGPYLVIWRSSSGHLDSQLKLLAELQQAIKDQLRRQSYSHTFPGALKEEVLQRLTGPTAPMNWPGIFEKHRWQVFPEFPNPQAVLQAAQDEGKPEVLLRICQVLEDEGVVLTLTPEKLKAWINEVITANQLQGICCLWDEFTEFFTLNPTLTGLQELAHAAVEFPFYLLLVTHRSPERVYGDQEGMKKILERFHNIRFHLQPVTTYTLAGHAIEVEAARREDWEDKRLNLWDQVKGMARHLFDQEGTLEEFKHLIPLHPYTAFLLSTLAGSFSSNQRTLFRFLKDDRPGGFARCLREYPQETGWYWITPDILWDYFFGEEAGETELTERVRNVVNFCRARLAQLTDPLEQRLFKGIMLFLALSWEMTGVEERLRPCRRNLALAFQGTPLPARLPELEESLRGRHCLNLLPLGPEEVEYTLPLLIDERRSRAIRDEIERQTRFEQEMKAGGIIGRALRGSLPVDGLARLRIVVESVAGEELQRRREHVQPEVKPYQIGVVLVACLTEQQLGEAERVAAQCASQAERVAYLVLQTPFTERRWERFKEQLAYIKYCQEIGDNANEQISQRRQEDLLKEWREVLKISSHRLFWGQKQLSCQGVGGFQQQVARLIDQVYSAGPEKISTLSTIYTGAFGVGTIKIGLGVNPNITKQFRELVDTITGFVGHPASSSPLQRLQAKVREFFQNQPVRHLADLWRELQEPPFGLFPAPITAVLLGFLLKEICADHYYCDGVSCRELNPDKMAELLLKVLKEQKGYEDISIRKSTPLAEKFCQYVKEVFNVPQNEGRYPEELKRILRQKIQMMGYPLWSLTFIKTYNEFFKAYLYFLQCFLKDTREASEGITLNDAELEIKAWQAIENWKNGRKDSYTFEEILAIINFLSEIEPVRAAVRQAISPENLAAGMGDFIEAHHPELAQELAAQKLSVSWVVGQLRELMQEEVWLWEEEVVKEKLPEVFANLLLLGGLNQLCGLAEKDLPGAIEKCGQEWLTSKSKLPWRFYKLAQKDEEAASLYDDLDSIMQKRVVSCETKARVGRALKQNYLTVREAVQEQAQVLAAWLGRQVGQAPPVAEARSLLKELPNLAMEADDQKIQQEILQHWEKLQHRRLVNDIQAQWQEISGSDSPQEWSRRQRMPITWVLTESLWLEFCQDFVRLTNLPEELLEKYRQQLQDHSENLKSRLGQVSGQILVQMLLGEYVAVFQDEKRLKQLQEYLVTRVGAAVEQWPSQLPQLQEAARQWLTEYYEAIFWPEVQATLDSLSVEQAKTLLQELVQDPGVGIRLLAKVRQNHGKSLS